MQWRGESGMNMYCMLIPRTEAVDESRGRVSPLSRLLEYAVIDKPIIAAAAASPGLGDSVVTGGGYQ